MNHEAHGLCWALPIRGFAAVGFNRARPSTEVSS